MLTIKPLLLEDYLKVVDHAATVGWVIPPDYIYQILKNSQPYAFGVWDDETIAATALATPYENTRAWVGMVITNPNYQKLGLARRLMDHLIERLWEDGFQQIMLDASKAGQPLYEKLGFRSLQPAYRLRRAADSTAPKLPATIHTATDLEHIRRLDAEAFGVSRPNFYPDFGTIYQHEDGQGFIMVQTWRENSPNLGAWVHANREGAADLLQAMLHLYQGQTIGVTTANDQARLLLAPYGFEVVVMCTRMILGELEPSIHSGLYYGSISMALG